MMAAAAMGATAFQKGLGAIHALSHPVGALYDTHHGLTNAIFMPYVLDFNRPAIEDRITRLAAYLRLPEPRLRQLPGSSCSNCGARTSACRTRLPELGVDDRQADLIADMAVVDPSAGGNPVPLDKAGAARIFDAAYRGTL